MSLTEDFMKGNNYLVSTKCGNCNLKQDTKIKKGNKASEVISNGKCTNCGCQELEII